MRALAFSLLFACAPKVNPGSAFDEDMAHQEKAKPVASTNDDKPMIKAEEDKCGKPHGVRTGTIDRAHLLAVLDQGPGMFLRGFEVTPRLDHDRFVGWQLVQIVDPQSPVAGVDVSPCDVLVAVNGQSLSKPDDLQKVWDSLRASNELVASLARGNEKIELRFQIEPSVQRR